MMDPALADRLYEAALVPELWSDTCELLARKTGAATASIFTVDAAGRHRYVTTPNFAGAFAAFIESEHRLTNVRPSRALAHSPFSFVRDIDLMSPQELAADPIRREFLRPHGVEKEAGWAFQEPTGHVVVITLMRAIESDHFDLGDLQALNAMKSDLARAAYMSSRLGFKEARTMTEALDLVGLPAAVIGDAGQAISMNTAFGALAPRIRTGAGDRLLLEGKGAHALLADALARFSSGATPTVQSLPMASAGAAGNPADADRPGAAPLILHLIPIRRAARDIFSRSMAILAVTEVGKVGPPDMRVLCGLFDLTPAEARVARGIAAAQTPEAVAQSIGISVETARSHLKRIMLKTGTTRQAELVLLLSGLRAPGRG